MGWPAIAEGSIVDASPETSPLAFFSREQWVNDADKATANNALKSLEDRNIGNLLNKKMNYSSGI
jgi:hypothetical protein